MTTPWLAPWIEGFAWPWLLLALPLPWLVRRVLPARRADASALRVPFMARLRAIEAGARRARGGGGPGLLAWLGWALLCVAAARPQALGEAVQPPQVGRDLMLALDLSGSMSEPDMELGGRTVDRLTAAKAVLTDFLDRRSGDRVGLIVFGRRAYVLAPLTVDRASVREHLLDAPAGLAGQETAIGDALALAVKRLRQQPREHRLVILLTDGVNTAGSLTPEKAAQLARDEQVRVHAVAFGGEGTLTVFGIRVPNPGGGADIDEATLREIAVRTGGRFFRARDAGELAEIYREIDRLEPIARAGEAVRPRLERYPWPLAAALACALLAATLGGRRWTR
ncbi:MAG TPA: VWA domain-containing protein [Lysobacter sp.]|nr:VWA domain-containing protein [Lysobacter sp.]